VFDLVLICNEEKIFEGEVFEVKVETEDGVVSILPNHQAYMTRIAKVVSYRTKQDKQLSIEIVEGFVYTNGKTCFVVVDRA
jgi:F0F1-type ATP synthase epsilon subunit